MPADIRAESPYERVLGEDISQLHPGLQAYFRGIPDGHHGLGSGTFARVGTPRRWLWPFLWVLARQGVLFPVWARDVPFTVVNRAVRASNGQVAVAADRIFHFVSGDRSMVDAITDGPAGLTDYLGNRRRYQAGLDASVAGGALVMTTTSMSLRLWNRWLTMPRRFTPVVTVSERFDERAGRQHVEVTTTVPGIGKVYEYAGSFEYTLVPEKEGDA